jgi:hypothetical protein
LSIKLKWSIKALAKIWKEYKKNIKRI